MVIFDDSRGAFVGVVRVKLQQFFSMPLVFPVPLASAIEWLSVYQDSLATLKLFLPLLLGRDYPPIPEQSLL
mgnify:CR=1 FL=1